MAVRHNRWKCADMGMFVLAAMEAIRVGFKMVGRFSALNFALNVSSASQMDVPAFIAPS